MMNKQDELLEDAKAINEDGAVQNRKVWYIDVDKMTIEEAQDHVESMRKKFKETK